MNDDKLINEIVKQLKKHSIAVMDIPCEYRDNFEVIKAEREYGYRKRYASGFDEIRQRFFVFENVVFNDPNLEEEDQDIWKMQNFFDSFEEYYKYLEGNIYIDSCYVGYDFLDDFSKSIELDMKKLFEKSHLFSGETIDKIEYKIDEAYGEVYEQYEAGKKRKEIVKNYIEKIEKCKTLKDLKKFKKEYSNSVLPYEGVDISFFFWEYINKDLSDGNRFNVIMEWFSLGETPEYSMIEPICSVYDSHEVIKNYNYSNGSPSTISKHKRKLRDYVDTLNRGDVTYNITSGFDKRINYYYVRKTPIYEISISGRKKEKSGWAIYKYFETFEELTEFLNNDLCNCDLSSALELDVDFSKYKTGNTLLPTKKIDERKLEVVIEKKYENDRFIANKSWVYEGKELYAKRCSFYLFANFVAYLNNDLSNADLLMCDGLVNIKRFEHIDFTNAKLTSLQKRKFGFPYEQYEIESVNSFSALEDNENSTVNVLESSRDVNLVEDEKTHITIEKRQLCDNLGQRVGYITDIHLMHKLISAGCETYYDVEYTIKKIVSSIVHDVLELRGMYHEKSILLIGGDISSNFDIFKLFVLLLDEGLKASSQRITTRVLLVLGNHEYWWGQGSSVDEIVAEYKKELQKYDNIDLLHNALFYKNEDDESGILEYDELCHVNENKLYDLLKCTRVTILGGTGFAQYNEKFNANAGIYKFTIDRETEIKESKKFEELYNKLVPVLKYSNTIIFTHNPKSDWSNDGEYVEKFVYVNGHTHRNNFHDDGVIRVYADNQCGYLGKKVGLKNFSIEYQYDSFAKYEDGIYEINGQQYNDFYRGKNLMMDFKRRINVLYMLKKNGYYCFIHKSKKGELSILNGGALERLDYNDINFYYESMSAVIKTLLAPLNKYSEYQNRVASEVKRIGGRGHIHGCIVDIDSMNHIYVNPNDLKITPYFAYDIIEKYAYPSVKALLKDNCPGLYANYKRLVDGQKNELIIQTNQNIKNEPVYYESTDIYKASREIRKMQKLESNILTKWIGVTSTNAMIGNED